MTQLLKLTDCSNRCTYKYNCRIVLVSFMEEVSVKTYCSLPFSALFSPSYAAPLSQWLACGQTPHSLPWVFPRAKTDA